jgi:hypothetical protein
MQAKAAVAIVFFLGLFAISIPVRASEAIGEGERPLPGVSTLLTCKPDPISILRIAYVVNRRALCPHESMRHMHMGIAVIMLGIADAHVLPMQRYLLRQASRRIENGAANNEKNSAI